VVFVLIFLIAVAVFAVAGAVVWFVRRLRSSQARIRQQVGQLDVERSAEVNFYGVASKGRGQVRGNGTLVLTPDELIFFQLMPAREIRVPRNAITGTEVARSFLGKTQGRDLLVVSWSVDGGDDKAAFLLRELDGWRHDLA
jgi:hypothetical protein